jgi:hypothetical protein
MVLTRLFPTSQPRALKALASLGVKEAVNKSFTGTNTFVNASAINQFVQEKNAGFTSDAAVWSWLSFTLSFCVLSKSVVSHPSRSLIPWNFSRIQCTSTPKKAIAK